MLSQKFNKNGFTLLELLIALSLSSLVMLVLAGGMSMVLKDWTRSSNVLDDSIDKVLVLLQIERAIAGAFPHIYLDIEENKDYIFFEGEADKMAWVSTVSPGRQSGLTAWQLLPNKEETGVEIRVVPAFASDPTERLEEHAKPITALEGYKASFEYLYVDDKIEEDSEWVEEWSAKDWKGLPNAVRVRLENQNEEEDSVEIVAVILAYEHKERKFRRQKP